MAGLRGDILQFKPADPDVATALDEFNASGMSQAGRGYDSGRLNNEANYLQAQESGLRAANRNAEADVLREKVGGLQRRAAIFAPAEQDVTKLGWNPGRILDYGLGQVGSNAASMQDPIVAAGAINAVGRVASFVPGPIGQAVSRVSQLAAPLVAYGLNQRQQTGENYGDMVSDPTLMARTTAQERDSMANNAAYGQAALDTVLPGMAARRLTGAGLKAGLSRLGAGAHTALDLAGEAGTEVAQEFIKHQALGSLNPNRDTSGDTDAYWNSAAGALAGAGPISAGSNLVDAGFRRVGDTSQRLGTAAGQAIDMASGAIKDGADKVANSGFMDKVKAFAGRGKEAAGNLDLESVKQGAENLTNTLRTAPGEFLKARAERNVLEDKYDLPDGLLERATAGAPSQEDVAFMAAKDEEKLSLVSQRLAGLAEKGDTEAATKLEALNTAPRQERDAVLADAAQHVLENDRVGNLQELANDAAARLGSFAKKAAGVAGEGAKSGLDVAKGLGKSAVDGFKGRKLNAQAAGEQQGAEQGQSWTYDQWLDEQATRRSAAQPFLEAARADPEAGKRAELAASYMADVARKQQPRVQNIGALASDLAFEITSEDQRAARFGMGEKNTRLNRLAGKLQSVYGEKTPEVLDQMAQIMSKSQAAETRRPSKALDYLRAEVAGRTPASEAKRDDETARQLVAAIPMEAEAALMKQGVNLREEGGRATLLKTVRTFADRGSPSDRAALERVVGGKDALESMLSLIDEGPRPEETITAADVPDGGVEAAAIDEGEQSSADVKRIEANSFEERMAQKAIDKSSNDSYVFRNNQRRSTDDARKGVYEEGKTRFFDKGQKTSDGRDMVQLAIDKEQAQLGPEYAVEAIPAEQFIKATGAKAEGDVSGKMVIRAQRVTQRDEGRMEFGEAARLIDSGLTAATGERTKAFKAHPNDEKAADMARAAGFDQRNLLFFTGKDGKQLLPVQAGELAAWGMKRLDTQTVRELPKGGNREFVLGLQEGIVALLASGQVGDAMPFRVTAAGKRESFAKGIPPSLKLRNGETYGGLADKRAYAKKKAAEEFVGPSESDGTLRPRRLAAAQDRVNDEQARDTLGENNTDSLDKPPTDDRNATPIDFEPDRRDSEEVKGVNMRRDQQPQKPGQGAPALSMLQRRVLKAARERLAAPGTTQARFKSSDGVFTAVENAGVIEITRDGEPFLDWTSPGAKPASEVAGKTLGKPQSRSSPAGTTERKLNAQAAEIHQAVGGRGFAATHDSPVRHDGRFDWRSHAGKGEGVMVKGAGTYLSTSDAVHFYFKKQFTGQGQASPTYQVSVDIAPVQLLNWDAPLSGQPAGVRLRLTKAIRDNQLDLSGYNEAPAGSDIYRELSRKLGGDRQASDYLQSLGILGHQMKAVSKDGAANPNYVIYDDSKIKTNFVQLNAERLGNVASQQEMDDAKAYVKRVLGDQVRLVFGDIEVERADGTKVKVSGEFIDAENAIRLATTAGPGVLHTAYHESMHALWKQLGKTPAVREALSQVAGSAAILSRINALLAGSPMAQAQLGSAEERVTYAYQFWAADMLDVGNKATTLFQKVKAALRQVLGMVRAEDRARELFEAFRSGALAEPSAAGKVLADIMAKGTWPATARKKFDRQLQLLARGTLPSHTILLRTESETAKTLAHMLYTSPGESSDGKFAEGNLNARRTMTSRYLNQLNEALTGLEGSDVDKVEAYLQKRTPLASIPFAPHRDAVDRTRQLLRRYFDYAKESGLDIGDLGKDYYPRAWDVQKLYTKKDEFLTLLKTKYAPILEAALADARKGTDGSEVKTVDDVAQRLWQTLVDRSGVDDKLDAKRDDGVLTPFFEAQGVRQFKWLKDADSEPFLEKNLVGRLTRYFRQGVRAAEYTARFGRDGEKLERTVPVLNDKGDKIGEEQVGMLPDIERELGENAPAELDAKGKKAWVDRRMVGVRESLGAMEGTLGKDINPAWRKATSWLMVYQNLRLLPLALFSSIVDPLGIVARGGALNDAYDGFLRGMQAVFSTWKVALGGAESKLAKDQWERLAEAVGAVDSQNFMDRLGGAYASDYLDEGARKVNNALFIANGMESWNRSMRIQATKSAAMFIAEHSRLEGTHSARWLKELGLKPADVILDAKGNLLATPQAIAAEKGVSVDQARVMAAPVQYAINRWVEGAILSPNAAQRPAWGSDPNYALFFHLKQFTYSFHQTILKRAVSEMGEGNLGPIGAFIWYVPVMIAADITKGLIQGGGELPNYMKAYTVGDWVMHGIQRAGLTGVGQMGMDMGQHPLNVLGPTVEQVANAVGDPATTTLVKALPANPLYKEALL